MLLKLTVIDALRHSPALRTLAGILAWARAQIAGSASKRAKKLASAMEFSAWPAFSRLVRRSIQHSPGLENAEVWQDVLNTNPRYRRLIESDPSLSRSILLKAPVENGEKGVLLMTFEYNWARLLATLSDSEFQWLDQHYDLVLSTSWSPTDYAGLACAISRTAGPVFVQSCNFQESAAIEAFHPRLRTLPTLPCDWINPRLYQPLPFEERTTDIVMVANWGEFKRHWDLFRALAKMPPDLKVVLIGQREPGRTKETILDLARTCGVPQKLEIHESIPIQEVTAHQSRAKVSIIMSRREGCCVAAVESLFAGCALAMRADAHVGPLAYIQPQTGRRLRPDHMAEDLTTLLREAAGMRTHEWAVENLANHVSRRRVNEFIKAETLKTGRPWTRDIIQPQWRPHPTYADTGERESLRPAFQELHDRYPKLFPDGFLEESWR